jgi:hypothetical protein
MPVEMASVRRRAISAFFMCNSSFAIFDQTFGSASMVNCDPAVFAGRFTCR